jgi:short-subunit dehydrogenase
MKKTWFITGCSKGFGRNLVTQLLENTDSYVIATARNIDSLADLLNRYNNRILPIKLDVTDEAQIKHAVDKSVKRCTKIDVLVNNAGYGLLGALEESSMQEIRAIFETNLFGLIATTKAIIPHMREQQSGHIMNFSSIAGLVAAPGLSIYNSTKFAVEGISEALAAELSVFGIKVTIIEPGPFRTDFSGESIKVSRSYLEYKDTPSDKVKAYLQNVHNTQPGDPMKAAKIIISLAEMGNPPLRLPLGNIAMDMINDKIAKQAEEFKKLDSLARSADFT